MCVCETEEGKTLKPVFDTGELVVQNINWICMERNGNS